MENRNILKLLGNNVKKYRNEMAISQEKLAEIAGFHRTYIGMIERAERNISLLNVEKIAKALNISISQLLED